MVLSQRETNFLHAYWFQWELLIEILESGSSLERLLSGASERIYQGANGV